jgi:hypothetical protein
MTKSTVQNSYFNTLCEEDVEAATQIAIQELSGQGRMLPASEYVAFNSYVSSPETGIIWYGDLDLVEDHPKLTNLAKAIAQTIYVHRDSNYFPDTPSHLTHSADVIIDSSGIPCKHRYI